MQSLESNVHDVALIFEGGGMRASYTAGVVVTLIEEGIFVDDVYGLSAGSSNTVNYLSRDSWRARASFVDLVRDPHFGGAHTMLSGKGYFSAHYIYQETGLADGTLPFDMDTFLANPAKGTIEAFEGETGKSVYWTKDDMPTLDDLMVRVRASSTLPLVMPSPVIDGIHYFDGGMGEGAGFLLPRAQRDGFERFLIIRTRPRGYRKSLDETTADKVIYRRFRKFPKLVSAMKSRARRYNELSGEIEQLEESGAAYVFYSEKMQVTSGTRDYDELAASFEDGYAQAQSELDAIREFCGV